MNSFSEWRDVGPLNESNSLADTLRDRLGSSSSYLKQALNFNGQPAPHTPEPIGESLEKQISDLEEKIKRELEKTREEANAAAEEAEPVAEEVEEAAEMVEPSNDYRLFRDREETFECNISIEGASLSSAQARIVVDTAVMNLVFYGKLYKDGRCLVQLKKMTMLPEGTRGQIRLEVLVDDTLFSPWESSCVVEGSKKVFVDVKQKKNVSVNFG